MFESTTEGKLHPPCLLNFSFVLLSSTTIYVLLLLLVTLQNLSGIPGKNRPTSFFRRGFSPKVDFESTILPRTKDSCTRMVHFSRRSRFRDTILIRNRLCSLIFFQLHGLRVSNSTCHSLPYTLSVCLGFFRPGSIRSASQV